MNNIIQDGRRADPLVGALRLHTRKRLVTCGPLILCIACLMAAAAPASATGTLTWNSQKDLVSADVKSENLVNVLEKIAAATGWHIYVEPDALRPVSTKFQNLAPGDAMHLLFAGASFAFIPATNASPKLYVFRTSQQNATQLVRAAAKPADSDGKAKVIPNQLIVRLKPGAKIDDIARQLGAKVIGHIDSLNAYLLQFGDQNATDAAQVQLSSNSDVASTENNYSVERPEMPQTVAGGASMPQLQLTPPTDSSGRTVIGLVDTAVQSLGGGLDQFLLKQLSVAGDAQLDPNSPSHGTSMAETMLRTLQTLGNGATSVQILPIDVYGANETTSTFDVAQGVALAVNKGANPINLSLGSNSDSQVLSDLIAEAVQKGIVFYAAKGNTPVSTPFYPAADSGVTAVTALDRSGQVASWANEASIPAVGALGTVPVSFNGQTFVVQGTSPATAIVSATAASLMNSKAITATAANTQIKNGLTLTTKPGM
jgi:hypothetical protein